MAGPEFIIILNNHLTKFDLGSHAVDGTCKGISGLGLSELQSTSSFTGAILLVVLDSLFVFLAYRICFGISCLASGRFYFSGAFKTCYKNTNLAECREFLRSFWNLAKSEQDSFDSLLCIKSIYSFFVLVQSFM